MKHLLLPILLFYTATTLAQTSIKPVTTISPLAAYSTEWNKPIYSKCNTAANAVYMTAMERDVIYILNLIRKYPAKFAEDVLQKYPDKAGKGWVRNSTYFESLMDTLLKLKPVNLLIPNKANYTSAECHATTSGANGYVGHDRQSTNCEKKEEYNAECCDYGHNSALDIVLALLIDENVPSLGHRWACLGSYTTVGVSIKPHTTYRYNSVIDFSF